MFEANGSLRGLVPEVARRLAGVAGTLALASFCLFVSRLRPDFFEH